MLQSQQSICHTYNGAADGCHDRTISWIDDLKLTTEPITSIDEANTLIETINLFPNPSKGIIEIQNNWERFNRYELIDPQGILVETGNVTNALIRTDRKGLFFLKLILKDNNDLRYVCQKILVN